MKRIITSILFIAMIMCSYAQTKRYYCELKGMDNANTGLNIIVDFGDQQPYSFSQGLDFGLKVVDETNGEDIEFCSMVTAANYMVSRGWQFEQAYSSTYKGNSVVNWIFYKEAENIEKAKAGIMTRDEYMKTHKRERRHKSRKK